MNIDTSEETRPDPPAACRHCEYASHIEGEDLFVLCRLQNREICAEGICDAYIYDLLKRTPNSSLSPALDIKNIILEPIDF